MIDMDIKAKFYRAPLGGGTIALSILALAITVFALFPILLMNPLLGIFLHIVIGLILLFCYFPIPKGYFIDDNRIVISRRFSEISIFYNDIIDIEYVNRELLISYFSIGVQGWFGWAGTFYYSRYGWVKVYSRKLTQMVLIYTRTGKKYAIAPEEPEDFIAEVELVIKAIGGGNSENDEAVDNGNGFAPVIEENGFAEVVYD